MLTLFLGLAAGFLMGFATIGLIIAVCRCGILCHGARSSSTAHNDGDVEAIPVSIGARSSSTTHDDGDVEAIPIAFAIPITEYNK
jgi:hypothetical protein